MNEKSIVNEDQVIEYLSNLSVLRLSDLIKQLEQKWNVKAAPMVAPPVSVASSTDAVVEEQTEFSLTVQECPADKKISVIKVVRELASLGLGEAKSFVESIPKVLRDSLSKQEAEEIKKKLEDAGAKVSIS